MLEYTCDFCKKERIAADKSKEWIQIKININYTGQQDLHCCPECTVTYCFKERPIEKENILTALEDFVYEIATEAASNA